MRIGIDVSILATRLTGIGRYTVSLIQALADLEKDTEWVLLGMPSHMNGLRGMANVVCHRADGLTGGRRVTWQQLELARLAAHYGVDLLHCPDFSRPRICSVPVVNTIHDLSFYANSAYFPFTKRIYKKYLCRVAVRKSHALIADSEFTSQEIQRKFGSEAPPVYVARAGVADLGLQDIPAASKPFLLHVGVLEQRKNLITLIKAYSSLRARTGIPHRLVLVGQPGYGHERVENAVASSPYEDSIDVLGYVDQERLVELYHQADAYVCPSYYEGFGLPVLEAMACGAPVICSRAASLPEIAGDAAIHFDPRNPEDLASAIEKVLSSQDLRREMRQRGFERVKLFTWQECARRHLDAYRRVLT